MRSIRYIYYRMLFFLLPNVLNDKQCSCTEKLFHGFEAEFDEYIWFIEIWQVHTQIVEISTSIEYSLFTIQSFAIIKKRHGNWATMLCVHANNFIKNCYTHMQECVEMHKKLNTYRRLLSRDKIPSCIHCFIRWISLLLDHLLVLSKLEDIMISR
jgi:hypothetical protein